MNTDSDSWETISSIHEEPIRRDELQQLAATEGANCCGCVDRVGVILFMMIMITIPSIFGATDVRMVFLLIAFIILISLAVICLSVHKHDRDEEYMQRKRQEVFGVTRIAEEQTPSRPHAFEAQPQVNVQMVDRGVGAGVVSEVSTSSSFHDLNSPPPTYEEATRPSPSAPARH